MSALLKECAGRCGGPAEPGPCTRYCAPCRSRVRRKRRKYEPTEFIDNKLRQIYLERCARRSSPIPTIKQFGKQIGWPGWALKRRAQVIGIAQTRDDRPWTEPEMRILEKYAWMSDERIKDRLRAAGFHRTSTAIHLKIRRTAARQNPHWYTARQLGSCFGVDSHAVTRWIRMGWLKARQRGMERTQEQGGDMWLIRHEDVKRFVANHPMQFSIRKVDQLWFVDLLLDGKVGANQSSTLRLQGN